MRTPEEVAKDVLKKMGVEDYLLLNAYITKNFGRLPDDALEIAQLDLLTHTPTLLDQLKDLAHINRDKTDEQRAASVIAVAPKKSEWGNLSPTERTLVTKWRVDREAAGAGKDTEGLSDEAAYTKITDDYPNILELLTVESKKPESSFYIAPGTTHLASVIRQQTISDPARLLGAGKTPPRQ